MFYKYVKHFCIFGLVLSSLQELEEMWFFFICFYLRFWELNGMENIGAKPLRGCAAGPQAVEKVCCYSTNNHHDFWPCRNLRRTIKSLWFLCLSLSLFPVLPLQWPLTSSLSFFPMSWLLVWCVWSFLGLWQSPAPIYCPHLCLYFYATHRISVGRIGFTGGQTVQSHSTMPCAQKSPALGLVFSSGNTLSSITPSKKCALHGNLLSACLSCLIHC